MADVLERPRRVSFFSRPYLGAIIACILAFGASSSLPNSTLRHLISTATGVSLISFAIAPALREISDSAQRWTMVAGSLVMGAGLGFVIHLFVR
jgi:ABC-type transport system involved in cytochrome c biogenesis permease subunit